MASILGGLAGLLACLAILAIPAFLLGLLAYGLWQTWQTWQRWQRARHPFPQPYDAGFERALHEVAYANGERAALRELGPYRIT